MSRGPTDFSRATEPQAASGFLWLVSVMNRLPAFPFPVISGPPSWWPRSASKLAVLVLPVLLGWPATVLAQVGPAPVPLSGGPPHGALPLEPLDGGATASVWVVVGLVLLAAGAWWLARHQARQRAIPQPDPIGQALLSLPTALEQSDRDLSESVVAALRVGLREGWGLEADRTTEDLRADPTVAKTLPPEVRENLLALWERADATRFRPGHLEPAERTRLVREAMAWLRQCPRPTAEETVAAGAPDGSFAKQLLELGAPRRPNIAG